MNGLYPLSSVIILDDDIFVAYGGNTGSSTAAMRSIAYFVAEEAVSRDLSTLLLPVTVTGTYTWLTYSPFIITDWAYVNKVDMIRFLDAKEDIYYSISGTDNIHASINNQTYGKIDIHTLFGNCNCVSQSHPYPYHIQVVYEAGLPTGTANQPNILLALTTYADMILNEIVGWGNESPGLVGVQEFRNQGYAEIRTKLGETQFGSSNRAQFISKLLSAYRLHRHVKLGH